MGIVLRTSGGSMLNCIDGVIPSLYTLGSQLYAIHVGLRRAFIERAQSVIVEIDNMEASGAIHFAHLHQHPELDDLIHQIITRIRDPNWVCSLRFIYSNRNPVTIYLSLLGGELFCRLYIFYEPKGKMTELLNHDMGLGPIGPQFLEAPMVDEEWEALDGILEDGGGALAEAFMDNIAIQAPGGNNVPQQHDVVFEEELLANSDEEDDLFDLF